MNRERSYGRLPLFYFGFAHLSLVVACALVLQRPASFVGFFYHPRMVSVVHLLTLGWISSSILGALYMIAPMALRTRLAERRRDWWLFWLYSIGVVGMVSHFWIEEPRGMLWGAHMVVLSLIALGVRVTVALWRARIAVAVKLHIVSAFANILIAGVLGILLGFNRLLPILHGGVLTNVYAHAHLAAVGWVLMMVMGVAYRLLPMVLPAAVPSGRRLLYGWLALEVGVLGLFISLLLASDLVILFALCVALSLSGFVASLAWMRKNPRPPARDLPRPDFARLQIVQALFYLLVAAALGLLLARMPESQLSYRLAPLYAVAGLLGCFAQMVSGVYWRQLPLFLWLRQAQRQSVQPAPPYEHLGVRSQGLILVLWTLAVPTLMTGLFIESAWVIAAAALSLLGAVLLSAVRSWTAARRRIASSELRATR